MTAFPSSLKMPFDCDFETSNTNTIHVGEKPKSISFSGCGFLGVYHIGVASCIKMHAPNWLKNVDRIYGCSAGSIVAAMLLSDVCFGEVCHRMMSIARDARARSFGPLSPGFKINEILLRDMRCGLPVDAHIRATGKLFISLTRMYDGKNVIVSDYKSREELIQVLLCSCFVPVYSGILPPKYRGTRYIDGGLSNNLPAYPDTITVSPWSGNSDICPRNDGSVSLVDLSFVNQSIQMTASNLYRISTMFYPPKPEVLKDFCCQGFRETVQYLRDHGLFETVHALRNNLSFSALLHRQEERRKITRRMSFTARCMVDSETNLNQVEENMQSFSSVGSSGEEVLTMDALEECFDENENESNDCLGPLPSIGDERRSQKVYTVIHVLPSLQDHVVKRHFELPTPMLQALEASLLEYGKPNMLRKPLSLLLEACGQSFALLPLDKTYSTACLILRHSAELPNNIKWCVTYLRQLVSNIHSYFKCTGNSLLQKLRLASAKKEIKLQLLAKDMVIAVQVIIQSLISSKFFHGVSSFKFWNAANLTQGSTDSKPGFNPRLSPLLQMV